MVEGYRSAAKEAERLTKGDRQEAYGHPLDDYTRTGWLWTPILFELWMKPLMEHLGITPPTLRGYPDPPSLCGGPLFSA